MIHSARARWFRAREVPRGMLETISKGVACRDFFEVDGARESMIALCLRQVSVSYC